MADKRNQHYVWKKYLEPWTKDGKISCLRNKAKIIQTNPRNIASKRYFYKINNLTYEDCQLIRRIFIDKRTENMKSLLNGWIVPIEKVLIEDGRSIKSKENKMLIEAKKKSFLENILEDLHMIIEIRGLPGLNNLKSGNLSFLREVSDDNEKYYDFLLYLIFQYFRTRKIKESVKESLGENNLLFSSFDDSFNLICPILSTLFANSLLNMIRDKNLFCYLIKNSTGTSFITGDQPVINTHAVFTGTTTKLELYYPLSPVRSLLITELEDYNIKCSVDEVKKYNDLIERQSLTLIFADNKSDLYKYRKNN